MSNPMWSKTTLAQAIGLAVAGTATVAANAAEPMPSISVTGYHLKFSSDDIRGSYYNTRDRSGFEDGSSGAIKLVIPVSNNWDAGIGFSRTTPTDVSSTTNVGPYQTGFDAKSSYETLDFEAGYNSNLGILKTRLSAGLRYIDLDEKIANHFAVPSAGYKFSKYQSTTGLKAMGLRIGGEGSIPFGKGFSASGALGASVLYAKRDYHFESKYAAPVSDKKDDTVYGFDSEVAVNYQTKGGVTASLGYTYSQMHNFIATDYLNDTGSLQQDGWFVRLNSTF